MEVLPNTDVRVEVCGSVWTYSPANLTRVDVEGAPLTPDTSRKSHIQYISGYSYNYIVR